MTMSLIFMICIPANSPPFHHIYICCIQCHLSYHRVKMKVLAVLFLVIYWTTSGRAEEGPNMEIPPVPDIQFGVNYTCLIHVPGPYLECDCLDALPAYGSNRPISRKKERTNMLEQHVSFDKYPNEFCTYGEGWCRSRTEKNSFNGKTYYCYRLHEYRAGLGALFDSLGYYFVFKPRADPLGEMTQKIFEDSFAGKSGWNTRVANPKLMHDKLESYFEDFVDGRPEPWQRWLKRRQG